MVDNSSNYLDQFKLLWIFKGFLSLEICIQLEQLYPPFEFPFGKITLMKKFETKFNHKKLIQALTFHLGNKSYKIHQQ